MLILLCFDRRYDRDKTDLDEMIISYSQDITEDYLNELVPFDKLDKLFTTPNFSLG